MSMGNSESPGLRRGVVAVIMRGEEFLVIRRSLTITAPGAYCFPGGGIELGETEPAALRRELREELTAEIRVIRRLWRNRTPSGVQLAWWRAELLEQSPLWANPAEVASVHWLSAGKLRGLPELLATNMEFLAALDRNEFQLD
jgi:8-oxo-dGTP pyrophosphatase MutT (NUDIX family)